MYLEQVFLVGNVPNGSMPDGSVPLRVGVS